MAIEQSITINRPARDVFSIYQDVDSWTVWDPDIEAVGMDGPFAPGTTGWLKPVGAPKTPTRMVSVNEPTEFTVETRLPLCTMSFIHELQEHPEHTRVTHRVTFTGILAPVFSRLIGRKIRSGIDASMQGLKQFAESR